MPYYLNPPPQGPVTRIVAGIIAALALVGAVMLGLVAFIVIAALAALAAIAIWLRVWWIKRRLEKEGFEPRERPRSESAGNVIDAEYTVIEETRDPPDHRH